MFNMEITKKYELTNEYKVFEDDNVIVYRIRALVDIPEHNVKTGDLGGFIESEDNLSHLGNCWVADEAVVYGYTFLFGNAMITGDTIFN